MSFLQAFNFSSPFQTLPNFGGFGVGQFGQNHLAGRYTQPGVGQTVGSPLTYTNAANNLLVNQNPQSPAAAAAAQLQIPQSIVPNYNPNAATDYYGNPNQNYANQQAPIPPEYQQQQQDTVQQQQQIQQQQLQLQQQQLQLQQQQQQLQLQGHNLVKLKPHVLQVVPDESQQRSRNREDNKDGFDVIIHHDTGSAEQQSSSSAEIDPNLPPTQQPRRGRRRNRKPPQVVNYTPVKHVEYYAPLGGHHVQLHSSSQKFSLHEVVNDPNAQSGQQTTQLKIDQAGDVSVSPAGSRGSISQLSNGPTVNNAPSFESSGRGGGNSQAGPGPSDFGIGGPQPQQQQLAPGNIAPPKVEPSRDAPLPRAVATNAQRLPEEKQEEIENQGRGDDDDATVIDSDTNNDSESSNNENINNAPASNQQSDDTPQQSSQSSAPQTSSAKPDNKQEKLRVTPIQGPIYAKDGMTPVVPLYSYNSVKNGTFYQIPILWSALSYALGLEIHGEIIRGLPCIKRLNQLYCPSAGTNYPLEKIEGFIDENKALIRRMYGEFIMTPDAGPIGGGGGGGGGNSLRRSTRDIFEDDLPEILPGSNKNTKAKRTAHHNDKHDKLELHAPPDDDHMNAPAGNSTASAHVRATRQTVNNRNGGPSQQPRSNRVDSCESTVEIVTPYWAANSGGKVRAIVNTQHFEQAIHQEVCRHTSTRRCSGDCGCEQKYKWHRLLAYDPDNDCRGIFMDWFLFPSCCVCRCNPQNNN